MSFINVTDPQDRNDFPFLCKKYPVQNGRGIQGLKEHFIQDIMEAIDNSTNGTEEFSLKVELKKLGKLGRTITIGDGYRF